MSPSGRPRLQEAVPPRLPEPSPAAVFGPSPASHRARPSLAAAPRSPSSVSSTFSGSLLSAPSGATPLSRARERAPSPRTGFEWPHQAEPGGPASKTTAGCCPEVPPPLDDSVKQRAGSRRWSRRPALPGDAGVPNSTPSASPSPPGLFPEASGNVD